MEVGSGVTKFEIGDVVGVGCIVGCCRNCKACKSGIEQYCNKTIWSYNDVCADDKPTQGGFARATVVDQRFVVKIVGVAPEQAAPLVCAGVTAYPLLPLWVEKEWFESRNTGAWRCGTHGCENGKGNGISCHSHKFIGQEEREREDAMEHLGAHEYLVSCDATKMQEAADSLDYIIDTIPVDGKLILMGLINQPLQFRSTEVLLGRKTITGSFIGSMKEMEEMLEFCGERNLTSMIEVVKMDYVNKAIERLEKNDV
ncbi:Alcohol dehydrogenase, N-terminal [Dillenia turbinata]|uniref:Alcohol dehydrogenase, N-terminal n=1 Tax=Dillenia turbinata TaxID=194707 RepID=A0AAN8VL17_9MAGN